MEGIFMRSKDEKVTVVSREKQLERRVRRGIVAGYVHEISARHRHVVAAVPVAAPARP